VYDKKTHLLHKHTSYISQALAYRAAELLDADELWRLLTAAYAPEISGSESFRDGEVHTHIHTYTHTHTHNTHTHTHTHTYIQGVRISEIVSVLRDR
jgi:hypothetical protein